VRRKYKFIGRYTNVKNIEVYERMEPMSQFKYNLASLVMFGIFLAAVNWRLAGLFVCWIILWEGWRLLNET